MSNSLFKVLLEEKYYPCSLKAEMFVVCYLRAVCDSYVCNL